MASPNPLHIAGTAAATAAAGVLLFLASHQSPPAPPPTSQVQVNDASDVEIVHQPAATTK